MARPTTEQRLADVHERCLAEFDRIQSAQMDDRLQARMDRRFVSISGAQYEGALEEQFANKPRFEFNRTSLAVLRIENEYRNNRITVDFEPRDGAEADELADACDGMYRADENACSADEAYDNAFREGISGGYGAWRLRACYEDDDSDEETKQRVKIEPIYDADGAVFFDLDAKRQDKSDGKRCYVLTPMTVEAYIAEYDDDPATWPVAVQRWEFDWYSPNLVWVAEVYEVEEKRETVQFYRSTLLADEPERKVTPQDIEDQPELLQVLAATGYTLSREKRVERRVVHKYIMSGAKVLEDCGIIAGKCIPIVPFFGRREIIDGIERCMGQVRLAKDAQRLTNMLLTSLADLTARFDLEKPILTPEQIAGHAQMWADDNIKRFPFLLINPITDANGQTMASGPVGYTKAPNIPPAMAALTTLATEALNDLLGNQQAGEEMQTNMSGKAVELIQNRLDMQVFIYMSNLAKSMKRSGEIWLSMMKDIAREESRRMKVIDSSGQASSVILNQPSIDAKTGEQILALDIARASYDVEVDVGPSSSSRRAATVRALTGMASITQDPETQQALTLATIANLEGEGLSDLRDWARAKSIRLGIIKPTDQEAQEMAAEAQNQQPDPQSQFLMAEAQKAEAQTGLAIANTEKARAQTAETLAGIETSQQQQAIEAVRAMAEIQRTNVQAAQP
jgi:hypothetical protein